MYGGCNVSILVMMMIKSSKSASVVNVVVVGGGCGWLVGWIWDFFLLVGVKE